MALDNKQLERISDEHRLLEFDQTNLINIVAE